ncbi:MAG: HigA family addiction module antidote protein [Vitreoscilla sp.]|nr:HigA family addiction module antidote protein [Vitreoscilla sp.]
MSGAALHQRPAGVPLRLPLHPGRFLERCCLRPMKLTQTDAAACLGISRRRVNEIVQGHRGITPDTAIRCALVFQVDADFWLGLQSQWDCFHSWQALRRQARRDRAAGASR